MSNKKATKPNHKERPEFIESLIDTIKNNGGLLTIFAVVLIAVSGIAIVDNPSNWWATPASIGIFFIVVFLFMNARVFIKIGIASILTLFIASGSFKVGSFLDPLGVGGLVWMCSTLFLFFGCLAFSYFVSSGRSRWGVMIVTQLLSFLTTYVVLIGFQNANIAVLTGLIVGFAIFTLSYKFSRLSRFSKSNMPKNQLTEQVESGITLGSSLAGFKLAKLSSKDESNGSFIVWNDKAFLLYPVQLLQALAPVGRSLKSQKLGYRGKSINPWLINIAFSKTPTWKSRGASIMTVLVDVDDRNGSSPKVIGVSLPDTKRKLPVGILPGSALKSHNQAKLRETFETLDEEFNQFSRKLKDKQKNALSKMSNNEAESKV